MRVVVAGVALALALLLAGCAEGGADAPGALPGGSADGAAPPEAGFGAVAGVVVDSVIRPVAGVAVALRHAGDDPVAATTDAGGGFRFDGVAAGAYSLATSHERYLDLAVAVVVAEGEVASLRLVLEPLQSNAAFVTQLRFSGFVECSFGGSNTCAAVDLGAGQNVTNDNALPYFAGHWTGYGRVPDWIQTEATWQTATAFSSISLMHTAASAEEWAAGDAYHIGRHWAHDGPPTYMGWNQTFAAENGLGTLRDPVYLATNGPFSFLPDPPVDKDFRIGAAVEQPFELVLHTFYGYTPPADWRFLQDPDVPQPP
jgi:hypothetical protein